MANRIPLVLITCGSFNPITNMHLRMFESAKNYFESTDLYKVVQGIISPVSDGYQKKGLVEAKHRCEMVRLALETNPWVKLSTWEAERPDWTPTFEVLSYHKSMLEGSLGSNFRLMLLCGGDLVETFTIPNVWRNEHIDKILSQFGLAVIQRSGHNPEKVIYENDIIYKNRKNIHLIHDWIVNDISSTKIRRAVSRNESIKYLVQDNVEDYIKANKLYKD